MDKRRFLTLSSWAIAALMTAAACSSTVTDAPSSSAGDAPGAEDPVTITVSAAASMQDALNAIQPLYEAEYPVRLVYNFGSSGSLAQQIEQGAPADVFLSASLKWMAGLDQKGLLLDGTRQDLLQNSMVLIVPHDKDGVTGFKDLETGTVSRMAIGEPDSVPAGQYAKEVLTSMNLFDPLQSKLVFSKDVRRVLSYVETGNVDAGLVYSTDAQVSEQVVVVATAPADSQAPIIYPVAVIQSTAQPDAAKAFIDYLSSDRARVVFEDYGFTVVD